MCGLTGIFQRNGQPASQEALARMTAALTHRGPDGEGYYVKGAVGLGHRRLAIIDLSDAGRQPMETPDGRYVISYNGELYNYRELKHELARGGIEFQSHCDTEVVLQAWAQWGPEALKRFNGMFAFALLDTKTNTLTLARDRYGIKPLYLSDPNTHPTVLFGSEIKAILAHGQYTPSLNKAALLEYFSFQNLFNPQSLFEGVMMLPAGCYTTLSMDTDAPFTINRYWDFAFEEELPFASEAEALEELDRLFQQAVDRQLMSDVELGSYLSGGMDSGSITALAARQLPQMKTFTVGFDMHSASGVELTFDEREKAEWMSYHFQTEQYEMVLKAGDMERILPHMIWHLEEPRVGQSYPNFYAAQLASRFCKVVLSGAGGDELFGGYPWRYYRAVVNDDFNHYITKYFAFWQRMVPVDMLPKLFAPIWNDVRDVDLVEIFRSVFNQPVASLDSPEAYVNQSLYFEAKTFLHGLLMVEDKLSMACGLESRVPFLDNDLVDFACRLPVRYKLAHLDNIGVLNENEAISKHHRQTKDGKLLLRKAMSRYIPKEVTEWNKQGFSAPDASWFKGDSIDYVRRVLLDESASLYHFLDYKTVRSLINDHLEGRQNRRLLIWSLLNFEYWCHHFLPSLKPSHAGTYTEPAANGEGLVYACR
ncbi:MAG: asparagine synthase (glutamine-hydrolyzing) [Cyanobacteria bacterium HKST-UBA04]|nr:asparagine synthase (glutamine-hydrolyzing) [Cyanobacteria bacterium HKST-UBA04]